MVGAHRETVLLGHHAGDPLGSEYRWRNVLIEAALHFRFVVEQIEMRRPACLKQKDHTLGPRRKIGKRRRVGKCRGPAKQRMQRRDAKSVSASSKHFAARRQARIVSTFHKFDSALCDYFVHIKDHVRNSGIRGQFIYRYRSIRGRRPG